MTLDEWAQRAETSQGWVRRAAWVVLIAGLLSFVVRGGDGPANPIVAAGARRPLPGFPQVAFRIATADGRTLDWCALLAATERARAQGLMSQEDLRGFEAMIFRYSGLTDAHFYMFGTTLELTAAWFDGDGKFIASTDLDPCRQGDTAACVTYAPPKPYRHALEVARGDLARLGIGPGSELSFPSKRCA